MAKRRVRRGRRRTTSRKKIELRQVRRRAERAVAQLKRVKNPTPKIRQALRAMKHCVREIKMLCGPIMSIPIPPAN
jgi:hypothetical protein